MSEPLPPVTRSAPSPSVASSGSELVLVSVSSPSPRSAVSPRIPELAQSTAAPAVTQPAPAVSGAPVSLTDSTPVRVEIAIWLTSPGAAVTCRVEPSTADGRPVGVRGEERGRARWSRRRASPSHSAADGAAEARLGSSVVLRTVLLAGEDFSLGEGTEAGGVTVALTRFGRRLVDEDGRVAASISVRTRGARGGPQVTRVHL